MKNKITYDSLLQDDRFLSDAYYALHGLGETVTNESGNSATVKANATDRNAVQTYTIADVKQVSQAGSPVFPADTVLSTSAVDTKDDSFKLLSGTITFGNNDTTAVGQNTKFTTELITGDVIQFTDNTG